MTQTKQKIYLMKMNLKTKNILFTFFRGKSHFEKDDAENCLMFQPMYRHFKNISGFGSGEHTYFWKSMR